MPYHSTLSNMELAQLLESELIRVFFYLQITVILLGMSIIRLLSGLASVIKNRHLLERSLLSLESWLIHLWAIFFLLVILQNWWQLWFFLEDMAERLNFLSFFIDLLPIFIFYILSSLIYPNNFENTLHQKNKTKSSKFSLEKYYIHHRRVILILCGLTVVVYTIVGSHTFGESPISIKSLLRIFFALIFTLAVFFPYKKYRRIPLDTILVATAIVGIIGMINAAPSYNDLKLIP